MTCAVEWFILAALLLSCAGQADAQEVLTISRQAGIYQEIAEQVVKEAYQRIGIRIQSKILASERSIVAANVSDSDGEISRIAVIDKDYPNLMIVPVAVELIEAGVFVKKVTF